LFSADMTDLQAAPENGHGADLQANRCTCFLIEDQRGETWRTLGGSREPPVATPADGVNDMS